MTLRESVEQFLHDFKLKLRIYDIIFLDSRNKNLQTLLDLEIKPLERRKVIENLKVEDYSEGPIPDQNFVGNDLWVFGKTLKNKEVYIKISMGLPNKSTICISFHIAEFPMKYPFK
ncbi:toxin [Lacihabitans sp. LS3-19]|uniref:hypothetical protein n=1 Tax=Lacihabitans sp. LS3-19 TaxID=2487335 RepID=UPI0020CDAA11|nr:hypothetical protein [Lacihabitans sp. LS3-19]MCP9766691.1 toxin [Lacihabitans sp. LS3-19]